MKMTLDELIKAMEPQAQKDKLLITKCIDGLTEYAAELRQRAGDQGKAQTPALRSLIDGLECYWGLDDGDVDHAAVFDQRMREADQANWPWAPTAEQMGATVQGLYRYAMEMISGQGSEDARGPVADCEKLMREIAGFWDFGSPVLDDLCTQMNASLREQEAWENTVKMGGIQ